MLSRLRSQMSPAAMVISMIALFVAIGGVAGALPGKKAIDKNDLKKNVVASKNVGKDALTGGDIKESSLDIPAAAVAKDIFGTTVNSGGSVTAATLNGTNATSSGGGSYVVTFPRSLQGCVPTATDDELPIVAVRAHTPSVTGGPNSAVVQFADIANSGFNLSVIC